MKKTTEAHAELAKIVAENINALCEMKKSSRKEKPKMRIAELCNVAPSAVTKWTDGRILPSVVYLLIIADYFGVDLMWLLKKHDYSNIDIADLMNNAVANAIAKVDRKQLLLDALEKGE
jgi:transcriptional regulator with XRE-family HTH domain